VLTLDVHSGFVGADRLWFPYARTRTLFPHVAELLALEDAARRDVSAPSLRGRAAVVAVHDHGDLWDYIYDAHSVAPARGTLLPLTLELGASSWLRKSLRVTNKAAFFHPLAPHRTARVLRRHLQLFEFLLRAAYSWDRWARLAPRERSRLTLRAQALWS
jgi:hypothetical protein